MRWVLTAIGVALLIVGFGGSMPSSASDELSGLVEAERSFARAAAERGVRDAFLVFFDANAVAVGREPRPAVPILGERPSRPFAEEQLVWEPRTGDIAASGELGWLTGPSTYKDSRVDVEPRYGNYLSVWRRRDSGPWRVYLDLGVKTPQPPAFDPGFSRARLANRYTAVGSESAHGISLADADARLNTAVLRNGMASGYGAALAASGSRLHRPGLMPKVGRAAAVSWLKEHDARGQFRTLATGAARSGDLGYSYGSYRAGADRGGYVRIWARDSVGRWWLMADATSLE